MKTAFLFSGQGAQYPGMLRDLYDQEPEARKVFECADYILGRSISSLCFSGTQEDLDLTHNTQPCVFTADLATAMALKAHGIEPDAVAGFSLGEYAALVYAGSIALEDAFRLVQLRADAMQEAVPVGQGAMAALMGADGDKAEAVCAQVKAGYVVPANYNSPIQTVISGDTAGVDEAIAVAADMGLKAIRLAVSAPFHCKLMEPAALRIGEALKAIEIAPPKLPVYCNVRGDAIEDGDSVAELLVQQAMSPVRWVQTLQNMQAAGVVNFIECGTGKTLWGLTRKTLKGVNAMKAIDAATVQETVARLAEVRR